VFNTKKQPDHHNRDRSPSDLGPQIQIKERAANPSRKKWGSKAGGDPPAQQRQWIEMNDFDRDEGIEESKIQMPKEAKAQEADEDNDDDDYSDDDFELQGENIQDNIQHDHALQVIQEFTNESKEEDFSAIQDQYVEDAVLEKSHNLNDQNSSSAHIEQFLKTATAQEMDIIRESLSGFQDVAKNFSNFHSHRKDKDKEDDFIEEEFEEEIPEVDDEGNDSSNGGEHNFEVIRKD